MGGGVGLIAGIEKKLMSLDIITLEVLRNNFDVIADEMELALLRTSFSPIVKEGYDASAALFTTDGQAIAQAAAIPIHLGCLIPTVARILQEFPAHSMAAGDAFIMNDPYDGGTHLPDTTIVQPIVYRGRTVALAVTMTHNQDIGGKSPGSIPTDATEIYQEGICIPPLRFYEQGQPNSTLIAILRKNVRLPDVLMGDLHGQIAAGNVGIRRTIALLDEYGVETVAMAVNELLDRSEAATREYISAMPDGDYSFHDFLDNDGVDLERRIRIQVTLRISGSDVTFDFSGSSDQVKGPVNSVASASVSGAYYVLRAVTDPFLSNNSGCYRMLHFVLPEGSVVNPRSPAPVNGRTVTVVRIANVIMGAFAQVMPQRIAAADSGHLTIAFGGIDGRTGQPFVTSEMGSGGVGARPTKDGIDMLDFGPVNCQNIPLEAFQMDSPLRIERFRLRRDSGGAGLYRGGLGAEKVFIVTAGEMVVTVRGERFFTQPWGLFGGHAGGAARAWIERAAGGHEEICSKRVFSLARGDRLHFHTPGGGGYGNPLERDPARVLEDVLDGKVDFDTARDQYGVVVLKDADRVDLEATGIARRRLAGAVAGAGQIGGYASAGE